MFSRSNQIFAYTPWFLQESDSRWNQNINRKWRDAYITIDTWLGGKLTTISSLLRLKAQFVLVIWLLELPYCFFMLCHSGISNLWGSFVGIMQRVWWSVLCWRGWLLSKFIPMVLFFSSSSLPLIRDENDDDELDASSSSPIIIIIQGSNDQNIRVKRS